MDNILSVSGLNNQIKSLLETTFQRVVVEGEVSNLTYHTSGHVYFSIKDDKSSIRCVMFRGNAAKLKFRLETGQSIIVDGGVSVYTPRGDYQISCFSVEPSGIGALALAFKQLKEKLEQKGWFDQERKKPLPETPTHLVLVTSETGAALQDMLRVAENRWQMLKISLINTLVQGEGAASSIAESIRCADSLNADVMIVGRGGGSIEDLWAFNEEIVAEAIYQANTPVVSAVGHEIDFLISDFVADVRAPTPSAAMEIVLPDSREMLLMLDSLMEQIVATQAKILLHKQEAFSHLIRSFQTQRIDSKIGLYEKEIADLTVRLNHLMQSRITQYEEHIPDLTENLTRWFQAVLQKKQALLESTRETFKSRDPKLLEHKGHAQVVKDGKVLDLEKLQENDQFSLQNAEWEIVAKVLTKSLLSCP